MCENPEVCSAKLHEISFCALRSVYSFSNAELLPIYRMFDKSGGIFMNESKTMDRRTKYSLDAIKNALFTLLEDKELSAITVTDICRTADVNRGTFYRYFKDVPDLFSHIEDEFLANFQRVLTSWDMSSYYRSILLEIQENSALIRFILITNSTSHILEKLLLLQKDFLLDILHSRCPHLSREDTEYIFEFILGGFIYFIGKWFAENMKTPLDDVERNISMITESILKAYGG
mgnify:CR=1 FL=1